MLPSRSQAMVLLQRKNSVGMFWWEPTLLNHALNEDYIPELRVEDRLVVTYTEETGITNMLIAYIDPFVLAEAYILNNHNGTPAMFIGEALGHRGAHHHVVSSVVTTANYVWLAEHMLQRTSTSLSSLPNDATTTLVTCVAPQTSQRGSKSTFTRKYRQRALSCITVEAVDVVRGPYSMACSLGTIVPLELVFTCCCNCCRCSLPPRLIMHTRFANVNRTKRTRIQSHGYAKPHQRVAFRTRQADWSRNRNCD
eukprot:GHVU01127649.1.p1 GENE.GHVU01127649.1~~GHVU01127649.1.p1  ORF type:complete len:253 (+),score=0.23 GHVU01127649.1:172-930(+)